MGRGEVRGDKPLGLVSMTHQHTTDKSQIIFVRPMPSGPSLRQDIALTLLVGRMRPAELAGTRLMNIQPSPQPFL